MTWIDTNYDTRVWRRKGEGAEIGCVDSNGTALTKELLVKGLEIGIYDLLELIDVYRPERIGSQQFSRFSVPYTAVQIVVSIVRGEERQGNVKPTSAAEDVREIKSATAKDGQHYGDLESAFVYRKQLVADCTCNGKDAFGLATLNAKNDPTLRPGDIVSTADGLMAFAGRSAQGAFFTPVNPAMLPTNLRPGPPPSALSQISEPSPEDDPGTIVLPERRQ